MIRFLAARGSLKPARCTMGKLSTTTPRHHERSSYVLPGRDFFPPFFFFRGVRCVVVVHPAASWPHMHENMLLCELALYFAAWAAYCEREGQALLVPPLRGFKYFPLRIRLPNRTP